jgi:hypothetical protein
MNTTEGFHIQYYKAEHPDERNIYRFCKSNLQYSSRNRQFLNPPSLLPLLPSPILLTSYPQSPIALLPQPQNESLTYFQSVPTNMQAHTINIHPLALVKLLSFVTNYNIQTCFYNLISKQSHL